MIQDAPVPSPARDQIRRGDPVARAPGGVVELIVALGEAIALLTLALVSTLAVGFGLGWGVVVVAAAVLLTGVVWRRDAHTGLVLQPVAARVLRAAAALAPPRWLPWRIGNAVATPAAVPSAGQRFAKAAGTLHIDLRRYRFTAGTHAVTTASGRVGVALAGDRSTVWLDDRYQGGTLEVRDYPASVDPELWSDWPDEVPSVSRPTRAEAGPGGGAAALQDWRQGTEVLLRPPAGEEHP